MNSAKIFKIGDLAYVGGCIGNVSKVNDDSVVVSGTYNYVDCSEPWRFVYDRQTFEVSAKWNEGIWTNAWNLSSIKPKSYF